jgi:hypothetical protein
MAPPLIDPDGHKVCEADPCSEGQIAVGPGPGHYGISGTPAAQQQAYHPPKEHNGGGGGNNKPPPTCDRGCELSPAFDPHQWDGTCLIANPNVISGWYQPQCLDTYYYVDPRDVDPLAKGFFDGLVVGAGGTLLAIICIAATVGACTPAVVAVAIVGTTAAGVDLVNRHGIDLTRSWHVGGDDAWTPYEIGNIAGSVTGGLAVGGGYGLATRGGVRFPTIQYAPDDAALIWRAGSPSPSNLTMRPWESSLSFRNSISNPWVPIEARAANWRPVFRPGDQYFAVDPNALRPGMVMADNLPPGHVSVFETNYDAVRNAVVPMNPWPRFPK